MRKLAVLGASLLFLASVCWSYPLDGYEETGIRRLKAYRSVLDGLLKANFRLPAGALEPSDAIRLRLADVNPSFDLDDETPKDPELQRGLEAIFGSRDPSYAVALLDITEPDRPRYAAIRPDLGYVPGSLGKLLVMDAFFHQLKKRVGADEALRAQFLKETVVAAGEFVHRDHHEVPIVSEDWSSLEHRTIRTGDRFNLWEWLDHMVSPSSNGAASQVWRETILMDAFDGSYPPPEEQAAEFIRSTPKPELSARAVSVIEAPLKEAGLDPGRLTVRTLFTANASRAIPGGPSFGTPRELVRWLIRIEQGKLVDRWSSLEMKKLIYFTRRRYRYSAAPELDRSAVFFKSGSLFRCRQEAGYECGAYRGNELNLMHSVAIVESPDRNGGPTRVYLVAVMSNVLRVNSAEEHLKIGGEIEKLVCH